MKRLALPLMIVILALGACTFVLIKGNGNHTEDTGGHGGGLAIGPRGASETGPIQRFLTHPDQH